MSVQCFTMLFHNGFMPTEFQNIMANDELKVFSVMNVMF